MKPSTLPFGQEVWERMVVAVEKVRDRLVRFTSHLNGVGIPYAVAGGNAVAAWVARVDIAAIRNTQDVDIVIRREDLPAIVEVMRDADFHYVQVLGVDMFLDGANGSPSEAVHILYSQEKVRMEYAAACPDVDEIESDPDGRYRHLTLEALVRMKLTSYRLKDQVHLQDLLGVGLLDATWPAKYPAPLRERLQWILDNPEA